MLSDLVVCEYTWYLYMYSLYSCARIVFYCDAEMSQSNAFQRFQDLEIVGFKKVTMNAFRSKCRYVKENKVTATHNTKEHTHISPAPWAFHGIRMTGHGILRCCCTHSIVFIAHITAGFGPLKN